MLQHTSQRILGDDTVYFQKHNAYLRFVIYEKGIEDAVDIDSPMSIGGMKSEEYLKLNCHGKVSAEIFRL